MSRYKNSINKIDVPLTIEQQFKQVQHLKTEIKNAVPGSTKNAVPGSTKNRVLNDQILSQTMRYRYVYKWHY